MPQLRHEKILVQPQAEPACRRHHRPTSAPPAFSKTGVGKPEQGRVKVRDFDAILGTGKPPIRARNGPRPLSRSPLEIQRFLALNRP